MEEQSSETRPLAPENIEQSHSRHNCEHNDGAEVLFENQQLNRIDSTKFETAVAEIELLREQLRQKDLELVDKDEDVRMANSRASDLESAQRQRDRQEGDFVSLLIQKDQSIQALHWELKERHFLGTFTKRIPSCEKFFGEENGGTNVVRGFRHIYSASKQILCRYEGSISATIRLSDQYRDLRLLVCKGLGLDLERPFDIDKSVFDVSKLNFQAVGRALVTSAFREWVFETDFPTFDDGNSKVLLKYREHLAKQGKPSGSLGNT